MINFRKQAGLICQHHSLLILVLPFVSAISDQVRLALAILTRHVLSLCVVNLIGYSTKKKKNKKRKMKDEED